MSEVIEYKKPINIVKNPWRRFFARTFDISIYNLLITTIELFVFRMNTSGKPFATIIEGFIACLIMVALEPLMLSTIGTTPGKWIFGLVLRTSEGEKVTYLEGLGRSIGVFSEGLGFGIPIYNLIREYKSYKSCIEGEELTWDVDFSYRLKDTNGLRIVGYIASYAMMLLIVLMLMHQAYLPTNRGSISSEEYYENCNDFMKFHEIDYGKNLTKNGQWVDRSDSNTIYLSLSTLPTYEIVENKGEIQKIIIKLENTDDHFIYSLNSQLVMAYNSFVGAEKSLSYKSLYSKEITQLLNNSFEAFEFEIAGIKVSNDVEIKGYHVSSNILIPEDNEEQYFHLTFVMERVN